MVARSAPLKVEELSTKELWIYWLLLPVVLTCFLSGIVGILVLTDFTDRKFWVSNTEFAQLYYKAIQWNPMINSVLMNGGMLGSFLVIMKLRNHRLAVVAKPRYTVLQGDQLNRFLKDNNLEQKAAAKKNRREAKEAKKSK